MAFQNHESGGERPSFRWEKIRIVWSRRPYLRRFGGSFTVPELQSLLFHKRSRDFLKGTWHLKMRPSQQNPNSASTFFIRFPFSVAMFVFEWVFNLIAMLVTQLCGLWGHLNGKVTACHHSLRGCRTFHTRKGAGGQQWQSRWHQPPVIFCCWWLLNGTICITLASRA